MLITTENLMLKCISKTDYDEEFQTVTDYYGNDLSKDMLRFHLETLQANIPADIKTFKEIVTCLKSLPPSSSMLCMPAANSVSERSFSALRRVKTYLRSTMKQERLNSLMTLDAYKERTDGLKLSSVANTFVGGMNQGSRTWQVLRKIVFAGADLAQNLTKFY